MSLKDYIEQNLISEARLPFPFLKENWMAHALDCDAFLNEEDFKLVKICIDEITHDTSIKCCLTSFFYNPRQTLWLSEWETPCDWTAFSETIERYSVVSYSGMYFFGNSEKWGGIIVDGALVVLGGESCFMKRFEELSGGYLALKDRFEKRVLFYDDPSRKSRVSEDALLMDLTKTLYSRSS